MPASSHDRRQLWASTAGTFVVALVFFAALFARFPVLYDTDSYYHLAIARAYERHGIIDSLPWAQLSLLHEFGDKELLFHLAVAPFADTADPTAGGRWMLAFFNALVAGTLTFFAFRAVGRWGLAVVPLLYVGSLDFLSRLIRLRPELLSLLLLLAAIGCAGSRRYRLLGVVAALYTLSYTAFHVFLGLCCAWFVQQLWARDRREWGLLLYPLLGVGVGLLAHPHFPQNLVVWKVQSLDFFLNKALLNVGREIDPQSTDALLLDNAGWWLALLLLWRAQIPRREAHDEPTADFLFVSAAFFGLLFLVMQRFSIYFIPLATLALLYELRRRGAIIGSWTALPWRGRVPLALGLLLVLALGLPKTHEFLHRLAKARDGLSREQEWSAFGRALPAGARVAADWGLTHAYMFWAPQATFLNVLDPVFMAVRYPQAYRALRGVMKGREPDVPWALRSELKSDYIALSRFHLPRRLPERLAADPRLRPVHQAYTLLYRVEPEANTAFALDWRLVPKGTRLPLDAAADIEQLAAYPRAPTPELRAVEGYVDAARVAESAQDCLALVHPFTVGEPTQRLYELAPSGPSKAWLDDRLLLTLDRATGAVLGRGVTFPVALEPGEHRLTVLTCPGLDDRTGFYLLER